MLSDKQIIRYKTMIQPMEINKITSGKFSYGLDPSGYTCRIKHDITLKKLVPTLVETLEYFEIPKSISGIISIKSTHMRNKVQGIFSTIDPGFQGYLTFCLINFGDNDYELKSGDGLAQIQFFRVNAKTLYTGQYNNKKDDLE